MINQNEETVKELITPQKMQSLLKYFSFTDIAKQYSVTRQHINEMYQEYVERKLIDKDFLIQDPIAKLKYINEKFDIDIKIQIVSFNKSNNTILVSVGNRVGWYGVYKANKGFYIKWSVKHKGKFKIYRAYLNDFVVCDTDQWNKLVNNLENNITNNKERL